MSSQRAETVPVIRPQDFRGSHLSVVPEPHVIPQRERPEPNLPMTGMLHFNWSGDQFSLSPTIRAARIAQLSQASGVQPWDTGLAFISNASLVSEATVRINRSTKEPIEREGIYWTDEGRRAQKARDEEAVKVLASEVFSLADTLVTFEPKELNGLISQYKDENDGPRKMIGEDILRAEALKMAGGLRLGSEDLYQPAVPVPVKLQLEEFYRPEDDLFLDFSRTFGQPRDLPYSEVHVTEPLFELLGNVVYIAGRDRVLANS